jgi:hypothetical protein
MGNDRCSGWLLGGGGMRLVAALLVSLAVAACSGSTDPLGISAPEDAALQRGYLGAGGKGGEEQTETTSTTFGRGYLGAGGQRPAQDSVVVDLQ